MDVKFRIRRNDRVDTKIKLKGAFDRALSLGIGVSLVLLAAAGLQAAPLWTNGAVNTFSSNLNQCDSGPNSCGSVAGYTIFDNFNVPMNSKAWAVSGFDFTDFLFAPTTDYKSTSWSIWNGDPLKGGTLVASGSAVASLSNPSATCAVNIGCLQTLTVTFNTGANVTLASGNTYYLGTSNVLASGTESSTRAFAAGGNTAPGGTGTSLGNWEQSNGSTNGIIGTTWTQGSINNVFPQNTPGGVNQTATAFDINGALAPEPGTLTLLTLAFAGLCFVLRRRVA
jgi:hypothetical protein